MQDLIFNIKAVRKEKNITVYRLAKITGISRQYLSDLENNKSKNPTVSVLLSIATALNVDVKKLFYTNIELNKLKKKLDKIVEKYGINSQQALEISQLIDLLIVLDLKNKKN